MLRGKTFTRRGQCYAFVRRRDYETKDGRWIDMLELQSNCPDCGQSFVCLATKSAMRRGELRRRCTECRAPGIPVKAPPPPKAASEQFAAAVCAGLAAAPLGRWYALPSILAAMPAQWAERLPPAPRRSPLLLKAFGARQSMATPGGILRRKRVGCRFVYRLERERPPAKPPSTAVEALAALLA